MHSCVTPKLCSYSYFVPNACGPCSCGICGMNPNCAQCGAGIDLQNSCAQYCPINKIYDLSLSFCLDCDESCNGCTDALSSANCTICAEGYYNNGGNCEKCYFKCKACVNSSTNCISCFEDSLNSDLISNNCVPVCHQGTYLAGNICASCNSQCQTCSTSPTNCITCPLSSFLSSGSCIPCSAPCLSCNNSSTTCISCQSAFVFTPSISSCSL